MKKILTKFAVFLLFIYFTVFAASGSESVSMFRGNPALTGVYNSADINSLDHVQFVFRINGTASSCNCCRA